MVGSGIRIRDPDPGSGKNLFRIPDPGVQKAPDSGSGSATLDFSHVRFEIIKLSIFRIEVENDLYNEYG